VTAHLDPVYCGVDICRQNQDQECDQVDAGEATEAGGTSRPAAAASSTTPVMYMTGMRIGIHGGNIWAIGSVMMK
jgi:hypothetical protein